MEKKGVKEKAALRSISNGEQDAVVFIADRLGENFCARDEDILNWEFDRGTERFSVEFKNRPGFEYKYSRERVALYTVKERYAGEWYVALVEGHRKAFEHAALLEPDIENAPKVIRVVYENGMTEDYPIDKAAVVAKAAASGLFRYLSKVEEEKSRGGGAVEQYLANHFKKLADYPLNGRAASVFLEPERAKAAVPPDDVAVIYPFGCNLSQMRAVDNALVNTVSLIEGPPGTGKTQTILNIIANLLIRENDVLVASPNNSATDNVVEKLKQEKLGFIVARLGNVKNQQAFIEDQPAYPDDIAKWALSEEETAQLQKAVTDAVPKMHEMFSAQQQLAADREELRQWELQRSYFLQHFDDVEPLDCRSGMDAVHLRNLRGQLTELADGDKGLGVVSKLIARFARGIGKWSDFSASPVELELRISRTIFEKEISRLRSAIEAVERKLEKIDKEKLLADVTRWSRKLLLAKLGERYGPYAASGRIEFAKEDLRGTGVRNEYPVVTSTVNAAIGQCGAMSFPFDYVIIDESSQCNLTAGLLALASAKHAVVVGDTKQLPCVISERDAMIADEAFDSGLDARYRYSRESLLSCLEKCAEVASVDAIPVQLLAEHYRCHPAIIRFCNQRFYGGGLVAMRDEHGLPASEALTLVEVKGHDVSRDYNRIQAGVAVDQCVAPLLAAGMQRGDIGIVTPYRKQADGMAKDPTLAGIEVDTVHKYQGREKDAMVFVTKVANVTSFVDDANLVNVSVSRAKERLFLVAAPGLLEGDGNIAELARYISYQGGRHVQADKPTMFDLLYPGDEGDMRCCETRAGAFEDGALSETIVEERLRALLAAEGMEGQVGFVRNYPLKMIVPRGLSLTKAEAEFVKTRAHVDFLFFRIVDKHPLAVLEVDGSQHGTPVQKRRDKLKDSVMGKAGIPLHRLRINAYKPDEWLEGMVRYVGTLADGKGSAACSNVSNGVEE